MIFADSYNLFDLVVILGAAHFMSAARYWRGVAVLFVGATVSAFATTAMQMGVL